MLDQYWVEIDLLRYKQQINIAKAIPIPIPIIVPTLFSLYIVLSCFHQTEGLSTWHAILFCKVRKSTGFMTGGFEWTVPKM